MQTHGATITLDENEYVVSADSPISRGYGVTKDGEKVKDVIAIIRRAF